MVRSQLRKTDKTAPDMVRAAEDAALANREFRLAPATIR